jgi:hypothetical protein
MSGHFTGNAAGTPNIYLMLQLLRILNVRYVLFLSRIERKITDVLYIRMCFCPKKKNPEV